MSSPEEVQSLVQSFKADYGFEQKNYAVTSTWTSKLGHPCGERWLYYLRTRWEQMAKKNWGGRGEKGNLIHDWWRLHVQRKGYQVVENEVPLSEDLRKKFGIGGRIDGRVNKAGRRPILYEFKTMNPHYYEKINSQMDMVEHEKDYIRSYPAQLQIYMYDKNEENGIFVLCNTDSLEWKVIPVSLDYSYCEFLLKRAEDVKKEYDKRTENNPFKRIPYGNTCKYCEFAHLCLPDIKNEGLDIVDNQHF